MRTKKRSKERRSKKGGTTKRWDKYKYALAQLIFTDEPPKNPFSKRTLVYGRGISFVDKYGLWMLEGSIYKTVAGLTGTGRVDPVIKPKRRIK